MNKHTGDLFLPKADESTLIQRTGPCHEQFLLCLVFWNH